MAMTIPHPLETWLKRRKLRAYKWAHTHGIGTHQLYAHLRGHVKNPSMKVMDAIEKATGGTVTLKRQRDWHLTKRSS